MRYLTIQATLLPTLIPPISTRSSSLGKTSIMPEYMIFRISIIGTRISV